jgi:carbonic anhydrase/acetyltransferase-like protein (isoleucine patch superfamily)
MFLQPPADPPGFTIRRMSIQCTDGVYLADTARLLGEVTVAEAVNLWYGAVVRGDVAPITLGPQTNVQDNAVIHCDSGVANEIGARVTIGHGAVVHGRSVGDDTLIGMHATVLGGSVVGNHCLIAAGALVPPNLEVPDGMLVRGVPGKIARPITDEERVYLDWLAPHYVKLAQHHIESPNDPTVRAWTKSDHR